ncbi:DUF4091 domain-containing protein [Dysgonomonas massiliensis]|uniref:DUF4091 domain-containing protein n=1 Tax=Dysgonomonas massiliensis TaxID=2040292 RepID=UPI000C78C21D|nr:DUF4091 domain-containing protein [Dysgonomonas massiliensis]
MKDPTTDTLSDWSTVSPGLHISQVPINQKYSKSVLPNIEINKSINISGWRGEKVSAQVVIWSSEDINQIECEFNDFSSKNSTLSADIAQARFVRYVMTDEFGPGCGYRKPEDFAASLAPDMLDNLQCFDLEAKTVRPIWITFDIPSDAKPGMYNGTLEIFSREYDSQKIDISINVVDRTLPAAKEWVYHLDLWQHPSAVARVHNLEIWSDEHFEKMKPLMKMLADGGQKVITATLNKDPWDNQCYDAYADMIFWTKKEDGSWTYDYKIFDKWVQFMMDLGITKMINCYSLLTWNNKIRYYDEAKEETIDVELKAQSKEYREVWSAFLKDFTQHLKDKKWLEITNIAMDERAPEDMRAALNVLKDAAPELGISLADNHKSYQQYPWIKDICVGADNKVDVKEIEARREKGLITTYYVCCSDKFPNMFTFSPSSESVYAAWYAVACDYDGFLRWAYNSWVENPLTDSRFRTWPAGDTYLVYPDARSSIRFERLIEGIQDAEKIHILRKEYASENTPESLAKLEKLNQTIAQFGTLEPATDWEQKLIEAKNILNRE